MQDSIKILTLDAYGTPVQWSSVRKYAYHVAKGNIIWTKGETELRMHGGVDRNGKQTVVELPTIIGVKGHAAPTYRAAIALSKDTLVIRDRHTCAYCGKQFRKEDLRMEHIHPESRGVLFNWKNIVAACEPCNSRKAARTPEEAKMPLLFVPYVPDPYEALIMRNRNILADQMEFLLAGVQKKSRLHPGH